jgi:hypothetical protein
MPVPAVGMGAPCGALRTSRAGGSEDVRLDEAVIKRDRRDKPLGSVRNGLPWEEFVRVAVARRFWKSLDGRSTLYPQAKT